MKLNYREKLFLLIFSVVVLVIIFCAWPIRSLRKKIEQNESKREIVLADWEEKHRLIDEIPNIEKQIEKLYNESSEYSKIFIESKTNDEVDQYVADILNDAAEYVNKNNLLENSVEIYGKDEIMEQKDLPLEFSYYSPLVVSYPIMQAADINGNLMETENKDLYEKCLNATKIETLEAQDVEIHEQEIEVVCNKTGFLKFIDKLAEVDSGIKVVNIKVDSPEYNFREEIEAQPPFDIQPGYSKISITIRYYTMQKIAKPEFLN